MSGKTSIEKEFEHLSAYILKSEAAKLIRERGGTLWSTATIPKIIIGGRIYFSKKDLINFICKTDGTDSPKTGGGL